MRVPPMIAQSVGNIFIVMITVRQFAACYAQNSYGSPLLLTKDINCSLQNSRRKHGLHCILNKGEQDHYLAELFF